ncbi:MAG: hypothetical protein M0R32_06835 [Candidatus Cloacimonetes bacterium]|jgi:hypothetical protein|nr:hypothetical protein [Candidatus Cloacimonadota bacterium]
MSFNLKRYASQKKAEEITENQLDEARSSKEVSDDTREVQLKDYRASSPSQLTEVQLDSYSVRNSNATDETPLEKKLRKVDKGDQKAMSTSEKQLEKFREGEPSELTEKQLTPERKGSNKQPSKIASKSKNVGDSNIEMRLNDSKSPKEIPSELIEGQLDDYHFDWPTQVVEKQLDAPRKSATQQTVLIEGQLNDSKGGLVKHRNEDASKGNINKLEEKRLAGEKSSIQEKQKAELASKTPKDQKWSKKPDADGLRLAQSISQLMEPQKKNISQLMEPESESETSADGLDGFDIYGLDEDIDELEDDGDDENDKFYVLDNGSPTVQDAGGTKIITGSVSFMIKSFLDDDGNLMKDFLEQKVKDHLSSRHSIKAPKLGEIRLNVQEQTGIIGYLATM